MRPSPHFRYVTLADEIQENINQGVFSPGEKLPSLRRLHHQLGLSITTVHQAYIELEKRGRVEAREKSGFYVRALLKSPLAVPKQSDLNSSPCKVEVNNLAGTILRDLQSDDVLQLGASVPARELMPLKQLSRILKSTHSDTLSHQISTYDLCSGNLELREALAKRMMGSATPITADDIITTNGCLEAVSLCLRAVTNPGDAVLVESPAFHCFLQLLEDLNLYVVEIPGRPDTGIAPETFEKVLSENRVSACLLNSNFQNPLGSVIRIKNKKAILQIARKHNTPIIEDDIYGDLYFGSKRPGTFKGLDHKGMVLYCSSFSKSLAPGLRTGWTAPGSFYDTVLRIKLNTAIASPAIGHSTVARFIRTGAYDRHLRQYRRHLKNQASAMAMAIAKYFPPNTRISFPRGGMFIWVELNPGVDSLKVYQKAYEKKISILPGIICSTTDKYKNCLRINCGMKWSKKLEKGIRTLGGIVSNLSRQPGLSSQ